MTAQVVTGIGTSHGPQLKSGWPEWLTRGEADRRNMALTYRGGSYDFAGLATARPDFRNEITPEALGRRHDASQAALDRLSAHLQSAAVDAIVIVSSDHKELFDDDLLPAFAVYWGETIEHVPFTDEQLRAMSPGLAEAALGDVPRRPITRPCHQALARHLIRSLGETGFDVSASRRLPAGRYGNHGLPHGWGFIYQRLVGEHSTIPMVPVFVNTFYDPNQPTAARCFEFGRATAKAIRSFPGELRVGVVASGGLSHFVIDEDLDRAFLAALESGSASYLTSLDPGMLRSGTSELRNWITVAGIAAESGLNVTWADYQPCYRTEAGTGTAMGFVAWDLDRHG